MQRPKCIRTLSFLSGIILFSDIVIKLLIFFGRETVISLMPSYSEHILDFSELSENLSILGLFCIMLAINSTLPLTVTALLNITRTKTSVKQCIASIVLSCLFLIIGFIGTDLFMSFAVDDSYLDTSIIIDAIHEVYNFMKFITSLGFSALCSAAAIEIYAVKIQTDEMR